VVTVDRNTQVTIEPVAIDLAEPKKNTAHILLVEDHPINQKLAGTLLERLGYTFELAKNGRDAVDAAEIKAFQLILMDMQMPEMDGLEATRKIREGNGPNANTWIVALTANAMQSDQEACRAAGMNDFISKPFSRDTLDSAISRGLDRPR
jgi:CheY-like chemotaxis protein